MPTNHKETSALAPQLCAARRDALAKKMHTGVALIFAAPPPTHHAESFRQNPNLLYLTGCTETNSALVIVAKEGVVSEEILYCQARDPQIEKWHGKLLGPPQARKVFEIEQAQAWTSVAEIVAEHLTSHAQVFVELKCPSNAAATAVAMLRTSKFTPSITDVGALLGALRMVKDTAEIAAISEACAITTDGFELVCAELSSCRGEQDIAAILSHWYQSNDAAHAFLPIVANGRNACIAHYGANNHRLQSGKLVLIDTGCTKNYYTADLSRVIPVSKKFTPAQQELHAVVVAAQKVACKKVKPQALLADIQHAASMELARGLIALGICRGKPAKVINTAIFKELYFHSIGHMLGLDVHDPFIYAQDGNPPPLRTNMVLTIEPGLYLDERQEIPAELRNTGIRIEDTVVVTRRGFSNLTESPKTAREVTKLLQ